MDTSLLFSALFAVKPSTYLPPSNNQPSQSALWNHDHLCLMHRPKLGDGFVPGGSLGNSQCVDAFMTLAG
jgi:hypothetical protein